jgi:radical SAM protein with 4Fe4S-binding SPASM domain
VLTSGLDFLAISTAGFDEGTYRRVFGSGAYRRMRQNVLTLLECNARQGRPIQRVSILIRSDRPLEELAQSPDFQKALSYNPGVHYTSTFSSFVDRIAPDALPEGMTLLASDVAKPEPCQKLFDSPIVLPDGTVLACDCYSAMDALEELAIGNVLERGLGEIWRGHRMNRLRRQFAEGAINSVCRRCDNYQDLSACWGPEGQERARLNRMRAGGGWERRTSDPAGGPLCDSENRFPDYDRRECWR